MGWTVINSIPGLVRVLGICAAVALAGPVSAAVSDFRLPPSEPQEQPQPQRQGPVAPDVPESRAPRPEPAPSPQPQGQNTPAPQVTPPPFATPAPQARPVARQTQAPAPRTVQNEPAATAAEPARPIEIATPAATPTAAPAPIPVRNFGDSDESPIWPWIVLGLIVLGLLGFALFAWLRLRSPTGIPLEVPQIERPKVNGAAKPPADGASAATAAAPTSAPPIIVNAAEPLRVSLEPIRLSLTLMNAALAYRLQISNHGTASLSDLRIGADMISAHSSLSRDEQLAGPSREATSVQRIDRLEPGESREISGEFRVPFSQIIPIRQGKAALLLPLARFRVEADGTEAVVRTFVVGQPGEGAGLQPFRLDLGPRIYPRLAQKVFA